MNTKEVYINGELIELDEKRNPIQMVYAINDLAELKDRQAFSTNTFKIPNTARNRRICGFPDSAALVQLQPYRKNAAKVVQNGVEIMPNGIALIKKAGAAIEIQVLSGLIGFFDGLGDKNIRDLDLSRWDHVWDLETVAESQRNINGFVYSVIDYGALPVEERKADATQLRPATFRRDIIEAIVAEAGYTMGGAVLNNEKYITSLIPFANDKFEHGPGFVEALSDNSASVRNTASQLLINDIQDFNIAFQDRSIGDPGNHWDGYTYTATEVIRTHVKLAYGLRIRDQYKGGSTPSIALRIEVKRAGVWSVAAQLVHMAVGEFNDFDYFDQVLEVDVDLNVGDQIRIQARSEPATNRVLGIVYEGATLDIKYIATDVVFGQMIQLSATLPDISQKDFFKDFLQNFGLTAVPDIGARRIQLINMSEVYANKPFAQNITAKLLDTQDDITFALNSYGVRNTATYLEDEAVDANLGAGVLVLDNLTLDDTVEMFISQFAATTSGIKIGGLNVAQITKISEPDKSLDFKTRTQPRILLNHIQSSSFDFYVGEAPEKITVQSISVPLFEGLEYQTLLDENYKEIGRMLFRPYIVAKKIRLSAVDVAGINWAVPVYDEISGAYYYRNQVTYLQDDLSTINLIRLA